MTLFKIFSFSIGPVGAALTSLFSIPIIAWLFDPADVGRISILQITISFSLLLFTLSLDQAYVREYYFSANKKELFATSSIPGLLIVFLVGICFFLYDSTFLSHWLFEISSAYISLVVLLSVLANYISRYLTLVLRMEQKGFAYSISQLLPKLFVLIIVACLTLVDTDLNFQLLVSIYAISYVVSVAYLIPLVWDTTISLKSASFNWKELRRLLGYSAPLVVGGIAFWGLTALDRVFLNVYTSYQDLAVYSVAISISSVSIIMQSIFSTIWAPTVYKRISEGGNESIVIYATRYMTLAVIFLFFLVTLISPLLQYVLPAHYYSVVWLVPACMCYPLLYTLSETSVVGANIQKKTKHLMLLSVFCLLINIILNMYLIPAHGVSGAVISTSISFWFYFVMRTEVSCRYWRSFQRADVYFFTFCSVSLTFVDPLTFGNYIYLTRALWLLLVLLALLRFRIEVAKSLFFIKKKLHSIREKLYGISKGMQ